MPEQNLRPHPLLRVPDRPAEQLRVGLPPDQVILRAALHRMERGAVFSRRSEHDDRDIGSRPAQAVEKGGPLSIREIEIEEHDVDLAPRCQGKPVPGAFTVDQLSLAPAGAKHLPEIAGTLPDQQHSQRFAHRITRIQGPVPARIGVNFALPAIAGMTAGDRVLTTVVPPSVNLYLFLWASLLHGFPHTGDAPAAAVPIAGLLGSAQSRGRKGP